jgi:RimJ/RimL family protein N-acetyltransferase
VIRGERVYLRAVERDDLQRCHAWMNDEQLRETILFRYPVSLIAEADWIERAARRQDPSEVVFAICLFEGDRHIGNCDLRAIDRENGTAALGIAIGEADCRGRGYGEDAVRTLCRFGFDELNLNKIRLDVFETNPRAEKTYTRVGFRREGVLRREVYRGGRYLDLVRMGLLREEFLPNPIPESGRRGESRPRPRAAARTAPAKAGE